MARYHDLDHLPSHRATPVRANKEIRQLLSDFLESERASSLGIDAADLEPLSETYIRCSYELMGRAPWSLTGKELKTLLEEKLPKSFTGKESYLDQIVPMIEGLLDFMEEDRSVPHAVEMRRTLSELGDGIAQACRDFDADKRVPLLETVETIVSEGAKLGRNDPCPCGSGKKVKKCCGL